VPSSFLRTHFFYTT